MLKIDKKSCKNIGICYIGYIIIKKVDHYENIYSVNPLYLIIDEVNGCLKKKNENTYLVFHSTVDEIREVLTKYTELWNGIKEH